MTSLYIIYLFIWRQRTLNSFMNKEKDKINSWGSIKSIYILKVYNEMEPGGPAWEVNSSAEVLLQPSFSW